MNLQPALEKARQDFRKLSPYVAAAKSGSDFREGCFRVPLLQRTILIPFPEGPVTEVGQGNPTPQWLELILLHYLTTADGTAVADEWITYRHLPGGVLFEARFYQMAVKTLLANFGKNPEAFRRAALNLGGIPMSRTGDAAFRFLALPRIPMAAILYLGDEDVLPSVSILFDASAPHYLPTEDLSYLGTYLASSLKSSR